MLDVVDRTESDVARPHGRILKNLTYKSSSALGLVDPEEKKNSRCFWRRPKFISKKVPFLPNLARFWKKPWGAVKNSVRLFFSSGTPSRNAELDLYVSFFQNSYVGLSYAAFRTGRFRRDCPELGNDYVRKGGNFHLSPKMPTFFIWNLMEILILLSNMI